MIRRRNVSVFSLSFLDCICCGFGAIILLFVLTMGSQTETLRNVRESLQRIMLAHLSTLADFSTRKEELQRKASAQAAVQAEIRQQDTLKALLDDLEQQIQYQEAGKQALLVEKDRMEKSIAALQKTPEMILPDVDPAPVGVTVGSNHIVFIIDTSGSMRNPGTGNFWPAVIQKVDEVLDVYPEVLGIQILDADGRFILGRAGQQWLSDNRENRAALKQALRRYDIFSNSNPVPGIYQAINRLHEPENQEMKMGIYVFGDEFTGTADVVLRQLDRLNPAGDDGKRPIVINAVGFPTAVRWELVSANTGLKYANLMREVCYLHGGAFIALRDL